LVITLENAPLRDDCTNLTDYVAETWIEGRFSQPSWNHYQTEGPRTNNHFEGRHNKLKKRVSIAYPTIYKLIDVFKKEQVANEVKIEQYSNGGHKCKKSKEIPSNRHKTSNTEDRIDYWYQDIH
jgi:hypothetical protein